MIFVHLFDKYSQLYPIVVLSRASRCVTNTKTMDCNLQCLNLGQIIIYLDCKPKNCSLPWYNISKNLSLQKHTCMLYGCLHGILSLKALHTAPLNEGDTTPHLATRLDPYITDTNRTPKGNEYQ